MHKTSRHTPSAYSFPSSSRYNMTPPLTIADRDAQAQRALLGDGAYTDETDSPSSPLNTPSPTMEALSPLSVASHLQDACDAPFQVGDLNPFLDASWDTRQSLGDADRQPVRSGVNKPSPMRQTWSVPATPEPIAGTLLPTIKETSSSSSPPLPRRPKPTTMNAGNTYSLPPSALGLTMSPVPSSSSGPLPMRRRPSPFPLGPVPPPPPPRRARYEPRPHIVDIATEQFGLKTPTISTAATTQLQQERERQWKLWDAERQRSLEMTKEAAKNNRVQPPNRARALVQEKSAVPQPLPQPKPTKRSGSKWWCFGGGGAAESDDEEVDEKRMSPSSSRLSSLSSESEADEGEWDAARANVASGLLGFSCQKKTGTSRRRATLKKRAL